MPATTAAVNNTSNVYVVPPLQPSPAKKVVPPRKSASVHAFSASKPPLVKTVSDHVTTLIWQSGITVFKHNVHIIPVLDCTIRGLKYHGVSELIYVNAMSIKVS